MFSFMHVKYFHWRSNGSKKKHGYQVAVGQKTRIENVRSALKHFKTSEGLYPQSDGSMRWSRRYP